MIKTLLKTDKGRGVGLRLIASLLLLICLFMPFAKGLKMTVPSSGDDVITTYGPAFSFIFSGSLISEHATYQTRGISVVGLLGFLFLLLSLVAVASSFFFIKDRRKTAALLIGVSIVLGLAGSIMMLSAHQNAAAVLADALISGHSESVVNTVTKYTSLQFGFIGTGIFGLLSVVASVASLFLDGTVDFLKSQIVH